MDLEIIFILAGVAFCAGFLDAIAGGGGLITLPALLLAGVEPVAAIATNKVQATSATFSATAAFARKGLIEWREGRFLIVFGALGGMAGSLFVSAINKSYLDACVPILLILIAVYFALSPNFDNGQRTQRISILLYSFTVAPLLGFYDGIFGPGIGSFAMLGFVLLCGLGIMRAMSFTKLTNVSTNVGSLVVFIATGTVIWPVALVMAMTSFAGAQLGARVAVKVGPRLVKPMMVIVCCALAIKLLSANDNPVRIAIDDIQRHWNHWNN